MRYIYKYSKYRIDNDESYLMFAETVFHDEINLVSDPYDNRELAVTAVKKNIAALTDELRANGTEYTSTFSNNEFIIKLSDGTVHRYCVESIAYNNAMTIAVSVLFLMIILLGVCIAMFNLFLFTRG